MNHDLVISEALPDASGRIFTAQSYHDPTMGTHYQFWEGDLLNDPTNAVPVFDFENNPPPPHFWLVPDSEAE